MRPYRVESAATLAFVDLVALVNRVYLDYPGPFSPEEPGGYAEFCRVQQIDLARSRVARDAAGAPIGLALLGLRPGRAWCGEFGVLPAWRRRGLGRALLAALCAEARAAGARDLRLEVAGANAPAQRLYASAGFTIARPLYNYAAPAARVLAGAAPAGLTVRPVDAVVLAADLGLPADPTPPWDRELPALLAADRARTLLAEEAGRPVGMLHYTAEVEDLEISRLAVRPGDAATARALLGAALAAALAARPLRLVAGYLTDGHPLLSLLPALGFAPLGSDVELCLTL